MHGMTNQIIRYRAENQQQQKEATDLVIKEQTDGKEVGIAHGHFSLKKS